MRFLDSNVLAYSFYENEHLERCQQALLEGGIANTFNLIEAFLIIEKETGSRERARKSIMSLLKSNVQIVEVNVNVVFECLRRISSLKLSIFDAIHYTTAILAGCNSILSYDMDFNNLDIPREEP